MRWISWPLVLFLIPELVLAQASMVSGNANTFSSQRILFNDQNQLIRIQKGLGDPTHFKYDVLGRRITKGTHEFVYLGDHVLEEELDGETRIYIKAVGTDDFIATSRDTNGNGVHEDSELRFLQSDHMRNTMVFATSSGAVIEKYDYEDYGQPLNAIDYMPLTSSDKNSRLFNGRPYDSEIGLYHYRNRYLDSKVGRFVTRDPLGNWGDSLNRGNGYAYAGSNPWTFVDPSGLKAMGPRELEDPYADFQPSEVDWERIEAFWGMVYDLLYADAKEDYIFVNPDTIDWLDERATPYGYKTPPPTREEFIQFMIEMMPVTGEMVEAEALGQVLRGELPAWVAIPILIGAIVPFTPAIGRRIAKWFRKPANAPTIPVPFAHQSVNDILARTEVGDSVIVPIHLKDPMEGPSHFLHIANDVKARDRSLEVQLRYTDPHADPMTLLSARPDVKDLAEVIDEVLYQSRYYDDARRGGINRLNPDWKPVTYSHADPFDLEDGVTVDPGIDLYELQRHSGNAVIPYE